MRLSHQCQGAANFEDEGMGSFVHDRHRKAVALFHQFHLTRRRLLDIGCGTGKSTIFMKNALSFHRVYGVDIDDDYVTAARANGVEALLCNVDQQNLPFEDRYFDAVFAGEVIEHVLNPDHLLQEIRRVLSKGGLLVVTTPNLASWFNRILLLFGWQPYETGTSFCYEVGRPSLLKLGNGLGAHLHLYTLRALKELLVAHGFEVLSMMQVRARESERETIARSWRWFQKMGFLVDSLMILVPGLGHRLVVAARPHETLID